MSDPEARAWDGRPPDFVEAAWHWLFVNRDKPRPIYWLAGYWQMQGRWMMPAEMQAEGWAYLAPCLPPVEPGADDAEVEVVALSLRDDGFHTHIRSKAYLNQIARAALAALAPLRAAERERAWRDEHERTWSAALEVAAKVCERRGDAGDCARAIRALILPAHGDPDAK